MMDRRTFLSAATLGPAALALPAGLRAAPVRSEDVRIIGEVLTQLHPGLYRYARPDQIAAGLGRLSQQWIAATSLEARYLNLARFLATIRCGHTYGNFFNQKSAVAAQLFAGANRLPFAFSWIGEQMVVTQNQSSDRGLPPGSVIKAIDRIPSREILRRLLPYVRADGANDGKRRALLSPTGADDIETFDVFYGLVYGAPKTGHFNIRYRAPNTASDDWIDMAPIDLAHRRSFRRAADPRSDAPLWQWAMTASGIAKLTMDSWSVYDSKWDWQGWLNDRMTSLKGARGLIVDLRDNEGGSDCGDLILARLAGKDLPRPRTQSLVRYRTVPAALNPYLKTWDDSFRDWGENAVPYDARFLRLKRWADGGVIAPQGPHVSVPLAVLTSAQNSSATYQFADLVRSTGLGKLVGGTTGGNQRGINGGAFFFVRLPESGLEFDLPLIGYFPDGKQPDGGLIPDLPIQNSAADIAAARDPEMAAAEACVAQA